MYIEVHFIIKDVSIIRLLFWNLAKNNNERHIVDLIRENSIDICVFAEYNNTDLKMIISELNDTFVLHSGCGGCDKITMIARKDYLIEIQREQNRYTIYALSLNGKKYILAGIHLQDSRNNNSDVRKMTIRNLIDDIKEQERILKHANTVVVGDFNSNPFDDELVQKDSFNAVLFKELIMEKEYDTFNGSRFRRFYNPMLNCISEEDLIYGTYYFSGGIKPIYWQFLDQVIVRKPLVNLLESVQIIKAINGKRLLKRIKPNSEISDHLPLIVAFERSNYNG